MKKSVNIYKKLSIILIVFLFLLFVLYSLETTKSNSKALVDIELYGWAINEDNNSQMYFGYEISNYGGDEARNVSVKCVIKDEDLNDVSSSTQNIGNIASETSSYKEFYTFDDSLNYELSENSTAVCYVESCENCEILYKNIPELVEYYEG